MMNQKGYIGWLLLLIISVLIIGAGGDIYFQKISSQVSMKDATASATDSYKINTARDIAPGLKQYYQVHQQYPNSLYDLVDKNGNLGTSYSPHAEGGVAIATDKASQDKFFGGVNYVKSPDSKHYVLSVTLQLARDWPNRVSSFNSQVQGIKYGVNCSDKYIYCVVDDGTSNNQSLP